MQTPQIKIGSLNIGGNNPIAVQTMCNTHTNEREATLQQCRRMADAGAQLIRITVPSLTNVEDIKWVKESLVSEGRSIPVVADIHFSSETAIAVAPFVDKVRINPGNFHKDHRKAREQFEKLLDVCERHGTAIRIGLNHGSLGDYITNLYGNTPLAMAKAAMEWVDMCIGKDFRNVVVSLKSSNTLVMVQAYRLLWGMMQESGHIFPLHVGVTEAGNGDSARIKSCVGIWTLLSEGLGDTIRVSLTEDPVREIAVGQYLSRRAMGLESSSLKSFYVRDGKVTATYHRAPSRERLILEASCDFGKKLLDREIDDILFCGTYLDNDGKEVDMSDSGFGAYLADELLQACRRRFYKPEYIACPGCGRTMYDIQSAFEKVKERTSHLKGMVIAVMGCIVNGPGEMADADWGYVGEGGGRVSIYHGKEPVLRHIPEDRAIDALLDLIEKNHNK